MSRRGGRKQVRGEGTRKNNVQEGFQLQACGVSEHPEAPCRDVEVRAPGSEIWKHHGDIAILSHLWDLGLRCGGDKGSWRGTL